MRPDLLRIYDKHKTFLDYFANDLNDNNAWYNNSEFARFHIVNGKQLLSVLAHNKSSDMNKISPVDTPGINQAECVLYCRAADVKGVRSEQALMIDGKRYQVQSADLIQGQVWKIELFRIQE